MELSSEQRLYCSEKCSVGKAKKEEFLNENNSAIGAALDMLQFLDECSKTCERCNKVCQE